MVGRAAAPAREPSFLQYCMYCTSLRGRFTARGLRRNHGVGGEGNQKRKRVHRADRLSATGEAWYREQSCVPDDVSDPAHSGGTPSYKHSARDTKKHIKMARQVNQPTPSLHVAISWGSPNVRAMPPAACDSAIRRAARAKRDPQSPLIRFPLWRPLSASITQPPPRVAALVSACHGLAGGSLGLPHPCLVPWGRMQRSTCTHACAARACESRCPRTSCTGRRTSSVHHLVMRPYARVAPLAGTGRLALAVMVSGRASVALKILALLAGAGAAPVGDDGQAPKPNHPQRADPPTPRAHTHPLAPLGAQPKKMLQFASSPSGGGSGGYVAGPLDPAPPEQPQQLSCDAAEAKPIVHVVVHAPPDRSNDYWRVWEDGASAAAGVDLTFVAVGFDAVDAHVSAIADACASADALVTSVPYAEGTPGYDRVDSALNECLDRRPAFPIVSTDTDSYHNPRLLGFVGPNSYEVGGQCARALLFTHQGDDVDSPSSSSRWTWVPGQSLMDSDLGVDMILGRAAPLSAPIATFYEEYPGGAVPVYIDASESTNDALTRRFRGIRDVLAAYGATAVLTNDYTQVHAATRVVSLSGAWAWRFRRGGIFICGDERHGSTAPQVGFSPFQMGLHATAEAGAAVNAGLGNWPTAKGNAASGISSSTVRKGSENLVIPDNDAALCEAQLDSPKGYDLGGTSPCSGSSTSPFLPVLDCADAAPGEACVQELEDPPLGGAAVLESYAVTSEQAFKNRVSLEVSASSSNFGVSASGAMSFVTELGTSSKTGAVVMSALTYKVKTRTIKHWQNMKLTETAKSTFKLGPFAWGLAGYKPFHPYGIQYGGYFQGVIKFQSTEYNSDDGFNAALKMQQGGLACETGVSCAEAEGSYNQAKSSSSSSTYTETKVRCSPAGCAEGLSVSGPTSIQNAYNAWFPDLERACSNARPCWPPKSKSGDASAVPGERRRPQP